MRKQYFVLFAIITFVIFVTVFMKASLLTDAQSDNYTHDFKYYKTYTVHAGDTLNEIASEYYPEEHYSNFNSYLYEICTINKLKNADHLNAGENIIIPYYSSEFK